MTERPMIGVRVSQEWKADLETIAARKGQTVSQVLYDSIAQYLDREAVNSVNRLAETSNHKVNEVPPGQVLAVFADLFNQVQALKGMEARVAETVTEQLQAALTGLTSTPTKPLKTALSPQFGKLPKTVRIGGEDHSLMTEALTTGEAYKICQERGLDRCLGTFREWLTEATRRGYLPLELQELGLEADFKLRRASHPKNKYLRWLRCRYEDF